MPRTPIPEHLIHRPRDVERNAERFDQLCSLAEEVAFPVVKAALVRETVATGTKALTDDARYALEMLTEEAAILNDLDEELLLLDVQKSLSGVVLLPDEEECRQHTRELSQVLMSTWLEILRSALGREVLTLSDYLLPEMPSSGMTWLKERLGVEGPKLPQILTDALASFAVNEDDAATVLGTLRVKLFSEGRRLELPFDLMIVGAPGVRVLAMTRTLFDQQLQIPEPGIYKPDLVGHPSQSNLPNFVNPQAQIAVRRLTEPVSEVRYESFAKVATD